jgi:hypothetical protein
METRLLTYAELGEALGITADSAKRLARRRGWTKQPGNDGRARVSVPVERLVPRAVPEDDPEDDREDGPEDIREDDPGELSLPPCTVSLRRWSKSLRPFVLAGMPK